MIYKQTNGPRGRKLWFKDGKLISVKDVPEDILKTMQPHQTVDDQSPEFRKCIFCGQLGTERKWLNQGEVDLCLEHYQERTTGEIVEQLRVGMDNKVTVN